MPRASVSEARSGRQELSLFEAGIRVSAVLARARGGVRETLDSALRTVRQTREIAAVGVEVKINSEDADMASYQAQGHWPPEREDARVLRAEFYTGPVDVTVYVSARSELEGVQLFATLLAQQFALWASLRNVEAENEALRAEIRLADESVALMKFMNRAKSLIVPRYGLSAEEAEEWLVGASVKHGKPLLNVAKDIVTVLSTQALGFDTAA
jgi:hypothetical protein